MFHVSEFRSLLGKKNIRAFNKLQERKLGWFLKIGV